MKKRTFCFFTFLWVLFFGGALGTGNSLDKSGTIIFKADKPAFGLLKLEVEETTLIQESEKDENFMFRRITDLTVDSRGSLYLLDFRRVLKFNKKSKFIARIGTAGQGPGEYNFPRNLFIHKQDNLYINDSTKLVCFDNKGRFIKNIPLGGMTMGRVFIDGAKNIYGVSRGITASGVAKILRKYNEKGEKVKDIAFFPDREVQIKGNKSGGVMGGSPHFYSSEFLFSPLLENRLCYCENLYYKIYVTDLSGAVQFIIDKGEKPHKISSAEMDEFKRLYGKEMVKRLIFPPHRPFIEKILSDEKGRIYVVRKKSILDDSKIGKVEIFGKKGRFLYEAEFPYLPVLFKSGCFYVIERDAKDETVIKKVKIKNYETLKYL
ncbi:MAG: 6-bladed beta-propeller [Candidatus Aminicenantes bacterium]|nr:6-bladed beta-propeller [Candidatus Aminicenantes bacterium]